MRFLKEMSTPKLLTTSVPFAVIVDADLDDSRVRLGWPIAGSLLGDFILYIGPNAALSEGEIDYYMRVCETHPHAQSVLATAQGDNDGKKFSSPRRRCGRKARHPRKKSR